MKLSNSRVFRIFAAAMGLLCAIACLLIIASGFPAKSEEPRNATPIEIKQAALEGQIEAMRKAGFTEDCLWEVGVFGKLCILDCGDTGFAIRLRNEFPSCSVQHCICEDEPTS